MEVLDNLKLLPEFLTTVTEGVVHGVPKVLIQSSFDIIRQHKARGGTWMFCDVTQGCIQISNGS